jgi:HEPN domain-containing protein
MVNRAKDWLEQARRDLDHGRYGASGGYHEWACFSAQLSAEKALKALYQHLRGQAWGHSVKRLVEGLAAQTDVDASLLDCGRNLDRYYIPTRYPNGFDEGKPGDYYSESDSEQAISCADSIIRFCERRIS